MQRLGEVLHRAKNKFIFSPNGNNLLHLRNGKKLFVLGAL